MYSLQFIIFCCGNIDYYALLRLLCYDNRIITLILYWRAIIEQKNDKDTNEQRNNCLRCALDSVGKPPDERLELISTVLVCDTQTADKILKEMDAIIDFVKTNLDYMYRKCIMRQPLSDSPDKFEIYHNMVDDWMEKEYPWMSESLQHTLFGRLSYR